ncbi:hypothetical protein VNI00_003208 [Paramarasmius palmivorus]|uniref:Uncharacterized protein n=1 Tax=Paramarasmius palmivorus TaxID=297713 RepID=A0AAW0DTY7_9AGAR
MNTRSKRTRTGTGSSAPSMLAFGLQGLDDAPVVVDHYLRAAVDHEEEKVYVLLALENCSKIYCLDVRSKTWDSSLHDLTFEGSQRSLPPCYGETMLFFKDTHSEKKYLIIVGGYIGDHPGCDQHRFMHDSQRMTIICVDINLAIWRCLRVLSADGAAPPPRYYHDVARIGDDFFIFGGRKTLPTGFFDPDTDSSSSQDSDTAWLCPQTDIFNSYAVLAYEPETGQWSWKITEESYPDGFATLGFLLSAIPIEHTTRMSVLLIPGKTGEDNLCHLDGTTFCLFDPSTGSFRTWDPRSHRSQNALHRYTGPSYDTVTLADGRVILAILGDNYADSCEFYHYHLPRRIEEFRGHAEEPDLVGKLEASVTEQRMIARTIHEGEPRIFVGCVQVNNKLYVFAKTKRHTLDTIVKVSLELDDQA